MQLKLSIVVEHTTEAAGHLRGASRSMKSSVASSLSSVAVCYGASCETVCNAVTASENMAKGTMIKAAGQSYVAAGETEEHFEAVRAGARGALHPGSQYDAVLGAGETEEQFEATCALVREVGFDRVNTAAYSPRPATPAAEWDNQVPP